MKHQGAVFHVVDRAAEDVVEARGGPTAELAFGGSQRDRVLDEVQNCGLGVQRVVDRVFVEFPGHSSGIVCSP